MNEKMRLQRYQKFQQDDIKRLNSKYNVHMFIKRIKGGKAFATKQKIRELNKLLFKGKIIEKISVKIINSNKLIKNQQPIYKIFC